MTQELSSPVPAQPALSPARLRRAPWIIAGVAAIVVASVTALVYMLVVRESSPEPMVLHLGGVNEPAAVAVDTAGTVYVADYNNDRVVEYLTGPRASKILPFNGIRASPDGVAVDTSGNV
ncbi:MAG TPA: hypothetical protein VME67_26050 [Mycobacterium sp.]|nr:hypothetical protein [Mycobacterium sp.]HTX97984.1 hypothetical protein [Mycobacterium sp.]